jgi:hypothetical protein
MQLELFQTDPDSPEPLQIWKEVNQEQRTILVDIVARLMVKIVRQETTETNNE